VNQPYVLSKKAQSEPFDALKLHSSIVSACLAVRSHEGEAHSTAERVCRSVIDWLAGKSEVTSNDIRRIAAKQLAVYHPEAAYLYQNEPLMI
jgi:transcriptional regulator NrdR family protein